MKNQTKANLWSIFAWIIMGGTFFIVDSTSDLTLGICSALTIICTAAGFHCKLKGNPFENFLLQDITILPAMLAFIFLCNILMH